MGSEHHVKTIMKKYRYEFPPLEPHFVESPSADAVLGLVRLEIGREPRRTSHAEALQRIDTELSRIQQELFNLGAELSTPGAAEGTTKVLIAERHVHKLEEELDAHNEPLPPLTSFILPGGGAIGSTCHLARTVCRRAERRTVALGKAATIRPETIRYLNRLSDYLFVLGRAVAHLLHDAEPLWDPKST